MQKQLAEDSYRRTVFLVLYLHPCLVSTASTQCWIFVFNWWLVNENKCYFNKITPLLKCCSCLCVAQMRCCWQPLLCWWEQPLATCLFNRSLVSLITLTVAVFEQNWDQTSVEPASSRKAFHPLKSGVQMLFSARFHWCWALRLVCRSKRMQVISVLWLKHVNSEREFLSSRWVERAMRGKSLPVLKHTNWACRASLVH